jgi:hypothetical protein
MKSNVVIAVSDPFRARLYLMESIPLELDPPDRSGRGSPTWTDSPPRLHLLHIWFRSGVAL